MDDRPRVPDALRINPCFSPWRVPAAQAALRVPDDVPDGPPPG